uniref:DUF4215 domain-containing protein n=1 Tax=Wuchereria bancrofti TaxID=6293 RepID=A0AAF5PJE5_WUCBA
MNVCGDGKRSNDEQCDDGNLNDGDGCSQNCLVEEKFHCVEENKLSPSVCYIYEGDGECEPFERVGYSKDCNNITASTLHPQYYPASIYAYSTILQKNCSLQFLSSAPLTTTVLSTESKPVLSIIGVNLQYTNKTTISLEEQGILSCAQNPLEIAIPYTLVDRLSNVKAVHLHVSNASRIIITAIILQSSKMFDLLALQNCAAENKYFDPVSASCVAKDCRSLSIGSCTPLNIPRSRVCRFYFVFVILSSIVNNQMQ